MNYDKRFLYCTERKTLTMGLIKRYKYQMEKLKEIVEFAVKYTPSAFNSQTARVFVLW